SSPSPVFLCRHLPLPAAHPRSLHDALPISFWLAAAVLLALVTAVCAGRTAARTLAAMPYRKRPSISARGIGMLAAVVLVAIPIAVAKFVYPKSWPTSVDAAVSKLHDELDREQERDLAY